MSSEVGSLITALADITIEGLRPIQEINSNEIVPGIQSYLNGSSLLLLNKKMKLPCRKLVVFVSSTFTDTMHERNLMLSSILQDLKGEIKAKDYDIDIQFVDMRYGVRDENTLDHDTWEACAVEIIRCYEESEGTFFISLVADKYGYEMAP